MSFTKYNVVDQDEGNGCFRRVYKFPNGYGARVCCYNPEKGIEIVVVIFDKYVWNFDSSTSAKLGLLEKTFDKGDIDKIMQQIFDLPKVK